MLMARDYASEIQAVTALQTKLQSQIDQHKLEIDKSTDSADSKATSQTQENASKIVAELVTRLSAAENLKLAQPYVQALADLHTAQQELNAASSATAKLAKYAAIEQQAASLPQTDAVERLKIKFQAVLDAAWQALQKEARQSLSDVLVKVSWPSELQEAAAKAIVQPFAAALALHKSQKELPTVLLPFEIMADPIRARFLYHFGSRRATNRLDKPEWFLQHILAVLDLHFSLMQHQVQDVLDHELPQHMLTAVHEFIRGVLPIVQDKIVASRKTLLEKPELLSHYIEETYAFDERLRLDLGFVNRDSSPWIGITPTVLADDMFNAWMALEIKFAEAKFQELIDGDDAWEIPEEAHSITDSTIEIRANASSRQLDDLLESLTQRFAPVSDLSQQWSFVEALPEKLLKLYHDRIQDSTEIFEVMTSGFSGGFPSADVAGKIGLQRLCRQLSGTSNVLAKLKDMVEDPYYLSITRADGSGCLDNVLARFVNLKQRIEKLIVSHLERELTATLKPFYRTSTWSSEETPQAQIASSASISPQLISTLALIKELFGYLSQVCSPVLLHRLYRELAHRLDATLYNKIVLSNNFSRRGALQLTRDVWEFWASFATFVARPEQGMRKLLDAQLVLSETAKLDADGRNARGKNQWETMTQLEVAERLLY